MKLFTKKTATVAKSPLDAQPPVSPMVSEHAPLPPPSRATSSDEGVPYTRLNEWLLVNVSTDPVDRRRQELHLRGRCYTHVSATPLGDWIYRHDS